MNASPPAGPPEPPAPPPPDAHDPYAAMRVPQYRRFLAGGVLAATGGQMLTVAIGWELYLRTNEAIALGLVGLAQVLPIFLFALPFGHLADRFDRRHLSGLAQCVRCCSAVALFAISFWHGPVWAVYLCLFVNGSMRALHAPARTALMTQIIPMDRFENAVRWNTTGFRLASVCGPAVGGFVIQFAGFAWPVYLIDAATSLANAVIMVTLRKPDGTLSKRPFDAGTLLAGLRFVWSTKVILGAVTLDMFAVLFGGVNALLPIYAKDILRVGADGLGLLLASEAFGALAMAVILAYRPSMPFAGKALLWSVAGFGLGIVTFGFSDSFALSAAALAACGAFDNISVIVRHTLIQLRTPNEMRGRVSAVNMVFISSSNELGQLESGIVSHFFGAVAAAVSGGIGTILVVLFAAWRWPELRKLNALKDAAAEANGEQKKPPAE